jgi:hypothetical protein
LAHPENPRRHPAAQRSALRGSLNQLGWYAAVTVNQRTGFVVDGHARIEEALSRHEKTVPVLYVDLSPDEERLALATLDPMSAMAERDQQAMDELLADIHVDDAGLQALLDSPSTSLPAGGDDKQAPEGPTDEAVCPNCGLTFQIGIRARPNGNEFAGGN